MLRRSLARLRRVALGLARPSTRGAYLAALRGRGGKAARYVRVPRGGVPVTTVCVICGHADVPLVDVRDGRTARIYTLAICPACGHVANPGNLFEYREYRSAGDMTPGPRVGTADHKGREFHMADMAVAILDRPGLDVLVYGAGRSLDNVHIERLERVRSVTISDIMRVRDDAPFIQADEPAPRRFDVVVASEVVEHFLDPRADFAHLFSFVEDHGLLVCSTNIMDGTDPARQSYPFFRGHVSLYSPRSLGLIARDNGYLFDFRLPVVATGFAGRRKRFILLTKSAEVMHRTAEYFGDHPYAPSDEPSPDGH